jgi:uncharacterized protein YndB with AHSA1/START domain
VSLAPRSGRASLQILAEPRVSAALATRNQKGQIPVSAQSQVKARVTRRLNVSPESAFDAWLDPEMIGRWMFGPALRDEEVLRISLEARLGGSFSFLVRRQGEDIDHIGQYLDFDRPRRLAFTWGILQQAPDTSRVTVDIVPLGIGCELTLTHELHPNGPTTRPASRPAGPRC